MRVATRSVSVAGTTLVELLAGLAVMSGVITGAYLCLSAGLHSEKTIHARSDDLQQARVALDLIASDLRHACIWSRRFDFAGLDREVGGMEADNVDFATHRWSPSAMGHGDWCEVSWFLDRHPRSGAVGLWRRQDPTPDELPTDGGLKEEIITGVRGFKLEYFDGFVWYDRWGLSRDGELLAPEREPARSEDGESSDGLPLLGGNITGLPEAVRVTLWLSGDAKVASPIETGASAQPIETGAPAPSMARAQDAAEAGATDSSSTAGILVFRTVVRLELAGRELATAGSTSSFSPTAGEGESSTDGSAGSTGSTGEASPGGRR